VEALDCCRPEVEAMLKLCRGSDGLTTRAGPAESQPRPRGAARCEVQHIGRNPLVLDNLAIQHDRQNGQSLRQIAKRHRMSTATVRPSFGSSRYKYSTKQPSRNPFHRV